MVTELLRVLLNGNAGLFLLCILRVFDAFTAVYLGLYRATARVYEGIVRSREEAPPSPVLHSPGLLWEGNR